MHKFLGILRLIKSVPKTSWSSKEPLNIKPKIKLSNLLINNNCIVSNVNDDDGNLLEYLNKIKIHIGSKIKVFDIIEFDKSIEIEIDSKNKVFISNRVAENILVTKTN